LFKEKGESQGFSFFVVDLMDLLQHIISTEIFKSPPKWEIPYDMVSTAPFIFTYF
jgi:hypothetical protein